MNSVLLCLLLLLESAGRLSFIISELLWLSVSDRRLTNGIPPLLSLSSFHAGPGPGDKDVMKLGFCFVTAFAGGVSVSRSQIGSGRSRDQCTGLWWAHHWQCMEMHLLWRSMMAGMSRENLMSHKHKNPLIHDMIRHRDKIDHAIMRYFASHWSGLFSTHLCIFVTKTGRGLWLTTWVSLDHDSVTQSPVSLSPRKTGDHPCAGEWAWLKNSIHFNNSIHSFRIFKLILSASCGYRTNWQAVTLM